MPPALAQLQVHKQPDWVPAGSFLIPVPCLELPVPSTPSSAPNSPQCITHSALVRLQLASPNDRGDGPGLTAHHECQEQPLVHWAQQLLALIKKRRNPTIISL